MKIAISESSFDARYDVDSTNFAVTVRGKGGIAQYMAAIMLIEQLCNRETQREQAFAEGETSPPEPIKASDVPADPLPAPAPTKAPGRPRKEKAPVEEPPPPLNVEKVLQERAGYVSPVPVHTPVYQPPLATIEQNLLDLARSAPPLPEEAKEVDQYPPNMTDCSACHMPQYQTPSGLCCMNGHGGADPLEQGGAAAPPASVLPVLDHTPLTEGDKAMIAFEQDMLKVKGVRPDGIQVWQKHEAALNKHEVRGQAASMFARMVSEAAKIPAEDVVADMKLALAEASAAEAKKESEKKAEPKPTVAVPAAPATAPAAPQAPAREYPPIANPTEEQAAFLARMVKVQQGAKPLTVTDAMKVACAMSVQGTAPSKTVSRKAVRELLTRLEGTHPQVDALLANLDKHMGSNMFVIGVAMSAAKVAE